MSRIHGQVPEHRDLAISALYWISSAFTPLKVDEIKIGLAVRPGDQTFDEDGVADESLILSVSAGLITIDPDSQTIVLVHFTVSEFFNSHSDWLRNADSFVVERCLACLSIECFEKTIPETIIWADPNPEFPILLRYANLYWGNHAARDVTESTEDNIADFLVEDHRATYGSLFIMPANLSRDLSGLYVAAYLGLKNVSQKLLANGAAVNGLFEEWETPLALASMKGHENVVALLLERADIDVNLADPDGVSDTPLIAAARGGQDSVVRQLIRRNDIRVNSTGLDKQTALSCAAERGSTQIVKLLLQREEIEADLIDSDKRTALSYAAAKGYTEIVKLLLLREDVNLNSVDSDGNTPLFWAAYTGQTHVMQLFLQQDNIQINLGGDGNTPLVRVALGSFVSGTQLLLAQRGVDASKLTRYSGRILYSAIKRRNMTMVELLIGRVEIDVNQPASDGKLPLVGAIKRREYDMVKLLLSRRDIDINKQDKDGWTPLLMAIEKESPSIVNLLLDRHDVDLNKADYEGRTPLSHALMISENETIVNLLKAKGAK